MTNVIVCSAAEVDYTESLCWYAKYSIDAANSFEQEFEHAVSQITSVPDRYPKCDDRHRFYLMRRFPFQIIYRESADSITIIAVAHTSRSPGFWTDR